MTVTPLYAGLLAALYLFLTFRVILLRRGRRVDMGDGGDRCCALPARPRQFRRVRAVGPCSCYCSSWAAGRAGCVHLLGLMLRRPARPCLVVLDGGAARPSRTAGMVLTMAMLAIAALLCLLQGLGLA